MIDNKDVAASKNNHLEHIISKISTTGFKHNRIVRICDELSKFDYLCFVEPNSHFLYRNFSFFGGNKDFYGEEDCGKGSTKCKLFKFSYSEINSISESLIPEKARIISVIHSYSNMDFVDMF